MRQVEAVVLCRRPGGAPGDEKTADVPVGEYPNQAPVLENGQVADVVDGHEGLRLLDALILLDGVDFLLHPAANFHLPPAPAALVQAL